MKSIDWNALFKRWLEDVKFGALLTVVAMAATTVFIGPEYALFSGFSMIFVGFSLASLIWLSGMLGAGYFRKVEDVPGDDPTKEQTDLEKLKQASEMLRGFSCGGKRFHGNMSLSDYGIWFQIMAVGVSTQSDCVWWREFENAEGNPLTRKIYAAAKESLVQPLDIRSYEEMKKSDGDNIVDLKVD